MPLYDYDCAACGRRFEVVHGLHDGGPTTCPLCGKGPVRKAVTAPAVHFKGSGWAKKERRSTARKSAEKAEKRRVGRRSCGDHDDVRRVGRERQGHQGRQGRQERQGRQAERLHVRDIERLTMAGAADWITLAEASEILRASNVHFTPATIGGWARAGRLASIKLGGRRYVRRGEVRALVAAPRRVRSDDLQPTLFEDLGR